MNIYIDESGSINNRLSNNKYFVICMLRVLDKEALKRVYKRFVSSNYKRLWELDQGKRDPRNGKMVKPGGKMFFGKDFRELKGAQFDRNMKIKFVDYFSRTPNFEIYYIKIENEKLEDHFCRNTARVFNYTVKLALDYFIRNRFIPNEDCFLQLDERNERTDAKFFLENYLNTELTMNGLGMGNFDVKYFDSTNNCFIQLADVFANLYYSQLQTNNYQEEYIKLKDAGILKFIFEFPK